MAWTQGKCESCGGILAVDSSLKTATCPFCGSTYVIQDAINNYNTNIKIDSLHADVVNVSDETSAEGRLRAADAYMKMGKFQEAEMEYKNVTVLTPQNYLGWLGLIEAKSLNYTRRLVSKSDFKIYDDYVKSVKALAGKDTADITLRKFNEYINNEIIKNNNIISEHNRIILEYNASWNTLNEKNNALIENINQIDNNIRALNAKIKSMQKIDALLWFLGFFGTLFFVFSFFVGFIFLFAVEKDTSDVVGLVIFWVISLSGTVPFIFINKRENKKRQYNKEVSTLEQNKKDLVIMQEELATQMNALNIAIQQQQKENAIFG